ncbi:MAG: hypothetical protein KDD53_01540 [Bdellovibrionales bacterium]|nr:hypothetical protein [Bdellovibrionales bacterium]
MKTNSGFKLLSFAIGLELKLVLFVEADAKSDGKNIGRASVGASSRVKQIATTLIHGRLPLGSS